MKTLRLYLVFLLVSLTSVAFAVTLPTYSFFGANELYAENQDNVEISEGIKVFGINKMLQNINEEWGQVCFDKTLGEQRACQDCCKETLLETDYTDPSNLTSYSACIKFCGGGPSLPLGSALWLLPFAFAYGIYKRYNNKKVDR